VRDVGRKHVDGRRHAEAIDEEAAAHGLTRSAFIASAALEKIRRGT
jgi:hypothetical protein